MIINEHLREIYENLLHIDESLRNSQKMLENMRKSKKINEFYTIL